ncbi:MAG TPA: PfkB family carbohydrate kinase [Bacilli bacterium]|nr:PfkB family carbohydrate kinase [Bacilli bacterium]
MKKILIIGGSNIDYIGKSFENIRQYDSNIGEITVSFGGVARNICENLARLELDITFVTAVGKDFLSQAMIGELQELGVKVILPDTKDMNTGGYLAIHNPEGDMELALCDQEIIAAISPNYLQTINNIINDCDFLVIDTNLESKAIDYLIDNHSNKTIIIDAISTKKAEKLINKSHKIDYLKCNVLEAQTIIGKNLSKEDLISEFIKKDAQSVIITDKAEEIFYLEAGKMKSSKVKSVDSKEIVNTTGVGDAMISGIIYGLVKDYSLESAIDYGKSLSCLTLKSQQANNKALTKEILEKSRL